MSNLAGREILRDLRREHMNGQSSRKYDPRKKIEIPVVAQSREGEAESGYVQNLNGTCKEGGVNSSPCPLYWHKKNRLTLQQG